MKKFLLAALALCLAPFAALAQSADKYPEKPIRIIVPFAPGGSVDTLGRLLAQRMNEGWGVPVLVENRPGAANMIGTQSVATAPPDGYTLLIAVSTHATNPALQAKVPYDGIKDFEPIALLARTPVVLFTHPSFPAKDLKSLIELGKAKTHTLNFGSGGVGTMTHLIGEQLKVQAGIEMQHIVYRGGTPAMTDLIAGDLPLSFATVAQACRCTRAGRAGPSRSHRTRAMRRCRKSRPSRSKATMSSRTNGTGCSRRPARETDHRETQYRDEARHGPARHG